MYFSELFLTLANLSKSAIFEFWEGDTFSNFQTLANLSKSAIFEFILGGGGALWTEMEKRDSLPTLNQKVNQANSLLDHSSLSHTTYVETNKSQCECILFDYFKNSQLKQLKNTAMNSIHADHQNYIFFVELCFHWQCWLSDYKPLVGTWWKWLAAPVTSYCFALYKKSFAYNINWLHGAMDTTFGYNSLTR